MNVEDLPDDCILLVLRYISYDEISHMRQVSRRMNRLCGQLLNNGFRQLLCLHSKSLRELKQSLPKRESERSKHHLSQKHSLLQAIDTRLSILTMTYNRWIVDGHVCFIPGKVLDELFRLVRIIRDRESTIATMKLSNLSFLQELRDLSSMAMEHFDDHIAPEIEARLSVEKNKQSADKNYQTRLNSVFTTYPSTSKMPKNNDQAALQRLKSRVASQDRVIAILRTKMKSQTKHINSLNSTVHEQNGRITEMTRQIRAIQGFLGLESSRSSSCDDSNTTSSPELTNKDRTVTSHRGLHHLRTVTKRTCSSDDMPYDAKRSKIVDY